MILMLNQHRSCVHAAAHTSPQITLMTLARFLSREHLTSTFSHLHHLLNCVCRHRPLQPLRLPAEGPGVQLAGQQEHLQGVVVLLLLAQGLSCLGAT